MNNYDKQAEDFCKRNGVKIITRYVGDVKGFPNCPDDKLMHEKWSVRIYHENNPKESLQFPFYGSFHDFGKRQLRKYDVLASISCEQYCPDNIEDFMAEYGYEDNFIGDMPRIRRIFNQCRKMADDLHRIFSERELEELSEIN